ncbi:lung seven transmembrane receptor-domain-containing protein [Daedaleopsis nitida]|nr:lung seven transmembrane receptor-domain-containing protein [Daedaleopsis nitida]
MVCRWSWLPFCSLLLAACSATAYEVPIADTDYDRQICSGMWGGKNTYINVTFDARSKGQLATVIYEWGDEEFLGKATSTSEDIPKTYVCTSNAQKNGLCKESELGRFIINVPASKSINDTSFWTARLGFSQDNSTGIDDSEVAISGFWDNPAGNPTPPDSNYTSPWRRDAELVARQSGASLNPSPAGILWYKGPIQYTVRKSGYYCVAIVPITVLPSSVSTRAPTDVPYHPTYNGTVLFRNTFEGKLSASDYPKVNFYFAMFLVYCLLAIAWGWLCWQNVQDLLPIQYYLSGLLGFLIIEMLANWAYYRYLNAHGEGTTAIVFLIVVAILDAGRNALSFFLLLVVSLGLSVVKESLGRTMLKCQLLAGAHFIFGVLYAVGIVELELESSSALVLLMFVIPLALTLSGFLLWIIYALNATITQLAARKQRYKLSMFIWLHRILMMTVVVIAIFFVVSSMTFSGRFAEDYGSRTWRSQWWLLDGWLALLYLVDFVGIGYMWRPSPNNRRLAMFDELAQDEEDAEDYDLESLERRTEARGFPEDDDAATLVGRGGVGEDAVVFEIGDEDGQGSDDEDAAPKKRRGERHEGGSEHEREGLMKDD